MMHTIIRRECQAQRCFLPFCFKLLKRSSDENRLNCFLNFNSNSSSSNDSIKSNRFYEKYAAKIEQAKKNAKVVNELEESEDKFPDTEETQFFQKSFSKNYSNQTSSNASKNFYYGKQLNDIVKMDLLKEKSKEDITHIWMEYHKNKDCVFAVIPGVNYDKIYSQSRQFPSFVYPIPKQSAEQNSGNAYQFVLAQFHHHQCFFTPLISFREFKENAPPCLVISHFPELQNEKSIVLMSGEYDKNTINLFDAQILAQQLQHYYGGEGKQRLLLYTFNKEPAQFQYMDLISELETGLLGISSPSSKK